MAKFKPGQSGNPAGRPKGSLSIIAEMRRQLGEVKEGDERTRLEVIIDNFLTRAESDDKAAIQVFDRFLGRPRQSITIDNDKMAQLERRLQNYLAESERAGDPMTRDEAIAILAEEDTDFELLAA